MRQKTGDPVTDLTPESQLGSQGRATSGTDAWCVDISCAESVDSISSITFLVTIETNAQDIELGPRFVQTFADPFQME